MSRSDGKLVVSYGGGVNSVAALLVLRELNDRPEAIVMADPGSENPQTWAYLQEWMNPRLRRWGWPDVTVISRQREIVHRQQRGDRPRRQETLEEECLRTKALPSAAYGPKKCSQKFKGEPQRWWFARQQWALDEWVAGRKLVNVIGYDFGEPHRLQRRLVVMTPPPPGQRDYFKWERERFAFWFPVFENRLHRANCAALIRAARMPLPPKSSCDFCPYNSREEWEALRRERPERFAAIVAMSRGAHDSIDQPDVVGLMRCNVKGRRQLHEWADGKYDGLGPLFDDQPAPGMPCECAL